MRQLSRGGICECLAAAATIYKTFGITHLLCYGLRIISAMLIIFPLPVISVSKWLRTLNEGVVGLYLIYY